MSVYNGEKYLSEAIESMLQQTFTDFEFLIINDASKDNSVQIIKKYNDPRIRLIHNQENLGLSSSLNKGLDLAQGQYIARM
ncbi:MAG: glycosyltransferase family 2 protein, partial [Promethearchaeota archaeon]